MGGIREGRPRGLAARLLVLNCLSALHFAQRAPMAVAHTILVAAYDY